MILIDTRGVKLLICGNCGFSAIIEGNLCPNCKEVPKQTKHVKCADPRHNDKDGCQNPDCWKYKGN